MGVVASQTNAFVWADTLVTVEGGTDYHVTKLAINPLARVIGVGGGLKFISDPADAVVLKYADLKTIVSKVSPALRAAAWTFAEVGEDDSSRWLYENHYAVAGWCDVEERFLAYEFSPGDLFCPRRVATCLYPPVSIDFCGGILQPDELQRAASEQAAILRKASIGLGRLTVATLNTQCMLVLPPSEIAAMPVPDIGASAPVAAGSTAVQSRPGVSAGPDGTSAPLHLVA